MVLTLFFLRYIPVKEGRYSSSRSLFYFSRRRKRIDIDNIEEILNRIVVEDYERRKKEDERRKQDDERERRKLDQEEHRKMRRSLTDTMKMWTRKLLNELSIEASNVLSTF